MKLIKVVITWIVYYFNIPSGLYTLLGHQNVDWIIIGVVIMF